MEIPYLLAKDKFAQFVGLEVLTVEPGYAKGQVIYLQALRCSLKLIINFTISSNINLDDWPEAYSES